MTNKRELLQYLATATVLAATGCVGEITEGDSAGPEAESTAFGIHDDEVVYLDQGWDDATRAAFYQTSQGSRMLPYSWFLHLEQAGSRQPLRQASNMRKMGFLVDERSDTNPDRLPVGFARDVDPVKGDQMGLTCAACHTGQLEFEGTQIRIDGGQSFADLEQLQNAILASLNATLNDWFKFCRFADDVDRTDKEALRAEMIAERDWWTRRIARSKGTSPHGPSRVDAFTIIGNEVVCELLGVPDNCLPQNGGLAVAPTQFPHLWGTPDFEWNQYNSSVHSPLGRNVGEVTGVFAEASLDASGVASSADLDGLHALETWLKDLQAPAWPEDVFGPIDWELADQGEAIYATACASCHPSVAPRSAPNAFGKTFAQMNFATPLLPLGGPGTLGTDPTAALSFAQRRSLPGPFAPYVSAQIGPDGKVPTVALLSVSGSLIIQRFFAINGFTNPQIYAFLDYRESRSATVAQITTYKARPLDGVAMTAPFLHNGSVPSMYELLLPPAQRTKKFYIGNNEYDPTDLGYSTERRSNTVLLDTTKTGNGNGGHVYGTTMSDADRYAVIEYIKTL